MLRPNNRWMFARVSLLLLIAVPSFAQILRGNNLFRPAITAGSSPITYFGSASVPADNGTDTANPHTITPPASMVAGDLVLIYENVRFTQAFNNGGDSVTLSTTGGQDWHKIFYKDAASTAASLWIYACRFNGTWAANPVVDDGGYTQGTTTVMHVFRPGTSSDIMDIDVMPAGGTFAAGTTPFTKTITGITTLNAGAVAIACWASVDDNTWDSLTAGWSTPGSAQYRNLGGSDQSLAFAYQVFSAAGATGNVAKNQATLGGDAGVSAIVSFYEHPNTMPAASPPAVDLFLGLENSTDGTAVTPTILANDTHGASVGTWTEANTPETATKVSTTIAYNLGGKSVTANGTSYDGTGTRSMKYDHTHASVSGYYNNATASSHAKISQGFWMNYGAPYNTTHSWAGMGFTDITQTAATSKYLTQGIVCDVVGRYQWGIHDDITATVSTGTSIYLSTATKYWCSLVWDKNNSIAKGAVFDSSFNQVGFTVNIHLTTPNFIQNVAWGCVGGSQIDEASGISYFDDMLVDWTNATFPLGPG